MNDVIVWLFSICISILVVSVVLYPLVRLCIHYTRIKLQEYRDGIL